MSPPKQRTVTDEFKREAVRLTETSGRTVAQVASDLGIGKSTLARLRLENKILRQERDFLKNAAAFFAKETSR